MPTPDAEDHEVAQELTKAILKVASNLEPRKTSISWFEFEKHKFRNEGCITLELLNEFSEQYTDFFTPADFLILMNDRLIAAHLISHDEYFMPFGIPGD